MITSVTISIDHLEEGFLSTDVLLAEGISFIEKTLCCDQARAGLDLVKNFWMYLESNPALVQDKRRQLRFTCAYEMQPQ